MKAQRQLLLVGLGALWLALFAGVDLRGGMALAQGVSGTPDAHHAAGVEHWQAGRLREALAEFSQALRLNRNHLPSLLAMADLLSSNQQVFRAYGVLQHAVRVAPASPQVHALLGRCLFHLKKSKEARSEFHRALELDPGLREPHFALAVIESDQGRLAEARRHIETYLEGAEGAEAVQALEVLARISLSMKDYQAGLDAYRRLQAAEPTRPDIPRKIAGTLLAAERYQEAIEAFNALREKTPDDRDVLLGLFEASYKGGAYEQAVAAMQHLAQREPNSCLPLINLSRARRMLNQFPQAREAAEQCLELVPGHAMAHYLAGRVWLGEGDLARAKRELEKAVESDPDYVDALNWLASVELQQGDANAALRTLEKAVSLDPEDTSVRYNLAQVYRRLRRPAEAKEQLEEFQRLRSREQWDPKSEDSGSGSFTMGGTGPQGPAEATGSAYWISLAKFLVQENKPRAALQVLEEARQLVPEDAEVLRVKAVAHTEIGEIEEALATYAQAEKIGPSGLLLLGRATIYFRLGEEESALSDLQRALSMDLPDDKAVEAHVLLASLLRKKRRYPEAAAELQRALALAPDNAAARGLLGLTLIDLGKPLEAAAECRRVLRENPEDASVELILARALIKQEKYLEASRAIERAAAVQGETALVLLARGELEAARGLDKVAIDYLTRAGQLDPSQRQAFFLLGKQLAANGRVSEAAVAFEKATIVDPDHAESWVELGRIYLDAQQYRTAVSYFRNAISAAPDNGEAQYQLALALAKNAQWAEAQQAARQAKALGHPQAEALLESLTDQKTP